MEIKSNPKDCKYQILVVDDNLVNRNVMQKIFIKLGHTTDIAENGSVALHLISSQKYDMVFMDIQMPIMNGIDAAIEIKKKYGSNGPIIIALTANPVAEFKGEEMDDYMAKPIAMEDIRTIIEKWDSEIYERREKRV